MSNNQQFLEDVRKLIDCELICERLLGYYNQINFFFKILLIGDDLKRDQLNFVFDNLAIVLESKGKEKMLKKEELITKISVPKLLVFKTLQKMRSVKKKYNIILKNLKFLFFIRFQDPRPKKKRSNKGSHRKKTRRSVFSIFCNPHSRRPKRK